MKTFSNWTTASNWAFDAGRFFEPYGTIDCQSIDSWSSEEWIVEALKDTDGYSALHDERPDVDIRVYSWRVIATKKGESKDDYIIRYCDTEHECRQTLLDWKVDPSCIRA